MDSDRRIITGYIYGLASLFTGLLAIFGWVCQTRLNDAVINAVIPPTLADVLVRVSGVMFLSSFALMIVAIFCLVRAVMAFHDPRTYQNEGIADGQDDKSPPKAEQ